MGDVGNGVRGRRSWRVFLTLVCVLLVAAFGTVQAAHIHADSADTHANCTLCAAAHVTVHPVQTPAPAPAATVTLLLEAVQPSTVRNALHTFALFTRPPPASALPA